MGSLGRGGRRGRQLALFDTELNIPEEEKEWIYAFNNKRHRLAKKA